MSIEHDFIKSLSDVKMNMKVAWSESDEIILHVFFDVCVWVSQSLGSGSHVGEKRSDLSHFGPAVYRSYWPTLDMAGAHNTILQGTVLWQFEISFEAHWSYITV